MVLLENDAFLSELTRLFQKSKSSGSLNITMKKYDGRTKPKPQDGHIPEAAEHKCLIRATVANKKLSTVVSQRDMNKFQLAYANVLKANMDGLKKKEKTKGKSKTKTNKAV
ncbi:Signal recognition particle 14 kDa protein [Lamellibrachia satsuma]|nr:Signal recognition particle 14 kDa protein [Lamellibrachia satsuma]